MGIFFLKDQGLQPAARDHGESQIGWLFWTSRQRQLTFTEVSGFHSFKADSNFIKSLLMKTCLLLGFQKMVKTIKWQKRHYRKRSFELSMNFSRNQLSRFLEKTPPLFGTSPKVNRIEFNIPLTLNFLREIQM